MRGNFSANLSQIHIVGQAWARTSNLFVSGIVNLEHVSLVLELNADEEKKQFEYFFFPIIFGHEGKGEIEDVKIFYYRIFSLL